VTHFNQTMPVKIKVWHYARGHMNLLTLPGFTTTVLTLSLGHLDTCKAAAAQVTTHSLSRQL